MLALPHPLKSCFRVSEIYDQPPELQGVYEAQAKDKTLEENSKKLAVPGFCILISSPAPPLYHRCRFRRYVFRWSLFPSRDGLFCVCSALSCFFVHRVDFSFNLPFGSFLFPDLDQEIAVGGRNWQVCGRNLLHSGLFSGLLEYPYEDHASRL